MARKDMFIGLGISVILIVGAILFGSSLPDGMEKTVDDLAVPAGAAHQAGWSPAELVPASFQTGPGLLAVSLIGLGLVLGLAFILGRTLKRPEKK